MHLLVAFNVVISPALAVALKVLCQCFPSALALIAEITEKVDPSVADLEVDFLVTCYQFSFC